MKFSVWYNIGLVILLAILLWVIKLIVGWNVAKWVLFGIIILAIISIMAKLTNPAQPTPTQVTITCKKKGK